MLGVSCVLGVLLAASNFWLIRQNRRLQAQADFYAGLRHTPQGIQFPALNGQTLDGRDVSVDYQPGDPETLMFVFSPTCPHCKRNWQAWLDLAHQSHGRRVVFVNVGGKITPDFLKIYGFGESTVIAKADPASVLRYSFFETPLTLLISPEGKTEHVWTGELDAAKRRQIEAALVRRS